MKKGKVFTKGQAAVVVMVLALGAAVWLNMKFSSNEKYLGQATFVSDDEVENETVATGADAEKTDYFEEALNERKDALEAAKEQVEELLDTEALTQGEKDKALAAIENIALRNEKQTNIETLLKAKGFEKAVAVLGEDNINIVVKSDGLTTAQTLQIQDIVTSQTGIALGNIKIVTIK
ncbi:MAG: SpoIIIAH-like family protein [Clostridia bacterium]|nr:SpoIIIAH-like family protein [Clostridia bacterium]